MYVRTYVCMYVCKRVELQQKGKHKQAARHTLYTLYTLVNKKKKSVKYGGPALNEIKFRLIQRRGLETAREREREKGFSQAGNKRNKCRE